ncbi:MAG TPA: AMP-binding protein [Pseudonocardia sp.]|nr:AMP-binding protein [Pseudonocardia sp.]
MSPDERVAELLARFSGPQACAAELLCDAHPAGAVAFTIVEPGLAARDLTFGELREESVRFAAVLADLGIGPGDAVGVLMGKSVDLVVALLGIWRRGAVHVPLFTALARPAIALRLRASAAKLVVVDADQRAKLAAGEEMPADPPWRVVVARGEPGIGQLSFDALMAAREPGDPGGRAVAVGGGGALVLLFTPGPAGVRVPLRALASFVTYLEFGLDVSAEDVYWNTGDPGWAYGLYHAILAPLAAGRRSLLLHAGFGPALAWSVIERFGVTNLAAASTTYRDLRADPDAAPRGLALRRASSAGEPLGPEAAAWSQEALGVVVREHYGQTELGMVIANGWADAVRAEVRPGSTGRPLPGWRAAVLRDDADVPAGPDTPGRVALDVAGSPLMWFRGYPGEPARTAGRFTPDGRWYLTGDTGRVDADGFFSSPRNDFSREDPAEDAERPRAAVGVAGTRIGARVSGRSLRLSRGRPRQPPPHSEPAPVRVPGLHGDP